MLCHYAAQSYSMSAASAVRRSGVESTAAGEGAAATDAASDLQFLSTVRRRWTSKRISAVEGSHLVLVKYSLKSLTVSQEDESAGMSSVRCLAVQPTLSAFSLSFCLSVSVSVCLSLSLT